MGVIACAWPIGVYQHVPLTGLSVVSIAGGAIVVLWLIDLARYRHPRIPFELLWPPVLIAFIAIVAQPAHAWRVIAMAILFLAALHFARQRADIERWLVWSAAACLVTAIADLVYRTGYGWPTAYAVPLSVEASVRALDAASASATSLSSSSITLLTGTGLWAVIAYRGGAYRGLASFGFLITGLATVLHFAGLLSRFSTFSAHGLTGSWAAWAIGGVGLPDTSSGINGWPRSCPSDVLAHTRPPR